MLLSREDLFATWAPATSRWSVWAKPILFTHAPMEAAAPTELPSIGSLGYARDAAVIADLPAEASVWAGVALAEAGFQPVPLYNAAAAPGGIIDMSRIALALTAGGARLSGKAVRPDAPPAFLLNAERMSHPNASLLPGRFDNRWCVVPQDMPSAKYLQSAGIKEVILISPRVADDLAHILHRYQDSNLPLRHATSLDGTPSALTVSKPKAYKSLWYRLGVFAGLRRNAAGGFGAIVPEPNEGGGG